MLAGCSSRSTTETSAVATATENTGVVAYVQKNMDKDDVGAHQAAVTLTGNEDADKAKAIKDYKNGDFAFSTPYLVDMNDVSALREQVVWNGTPDEHYVVAVAKEGYDDEDLGDFILDVMKKNYEVAKNTTSADPRYVFTKISVFDAEVAYSSSLYSSSTTIDGTTIDNLTTEYWVIVFNTAAKADTSSSLIA